MTKNLRLKVLNEKYKSKIIKIPKFSIKSSSCKDLKVERGLQQLQIYNLKNNQQHREILKIVNNILKKYYEIIVKNHCEKL